MNGTDKSIGANPVFDSIVTNLASGARRRLVLQGLAAGLMATAGGSVTSNALAKSHRSKKKGRRSPNPGPNPTPAAQSICPPGKSLGFIGVPADGSQVFTPVLEKDVSYLLRATGFWSTNGNDAVDAFAGFAFANQTQTFLFSNGIRVGLAVNGESPDNWGHYAESHEYNLVLIGKGQRASLQMLDSDFRDNARLLNVEVLCAR
jgi:hypothetical protein